MFNNNLLLDLGLHKLLSINLWAICEMFANLGIMNQAKFYTLDLKSPGQHCTHPFQQCSAQRQVRGFFFLQTAAVWIQVQATAAK